MDQLKCKRCNKQPVKEGRLCCESCLAKQKEFAVIRRQKLKEKNVCDACGKNQRKNNSIYCQGCLSLQKTKRENRKLNGCCIVCGEKAIDGKVTCFTCNNYQKKQSLKIREVRRASGFCIKCGKDKPIHPHIKCDKCLAKQNTNQRQLSVLRRENGLCVNCGEIAISGNRFCETCYLKHIASKRTGDTSRWNELKLIFESQNALCPYSGQKLVIGKNTDLDHKIPVANSGSNDFSNLQWVYSPINTMKWHWSETEFFDLITKVYKYCIGNKLQDVKIKF